MRGRRFPLVGTISMDNVTVDVGPDTEVRQGDVATLIGSRGRGAHPGRGARSPAGNDQLRDQLRGHSARPASAHVSTGALVAHGPLRGPEDCARCRRRPRALGCGRDCAGPAHGETHRRPRPGGHRRRQGSCPRAGRCRGWSRVLAFRSLRRLARDRAGSKLAGGHYADAWRVDRGRSRPARLHGERDGGPAPFRRTAARSARRPRGPG